MIERDCISLLRTAGAILCLCAIGGCGAAGGDLPPAEAPKVTVALPIVREVRDIDEYTGRVEAAQTVEVRARVGGYLQEIYFNDGDYVNAGDPLFLIDPRTYQAEHDQAVAKINLYDAKYKFAKSVRVRNERLAASGSVSKEEYEQTVASENESLAAMRSAEADAERYKLNLEFTQVNAEIAGRIDRRLVTKGNLVESGPVATLLTTIVSVDPIYVYFNPDEMAFLKYSQRRVAADGAMETQHVRERNIEVTIILADGTIYPTKGQINFAANRVDPATGTIQVRASFLNPQRALTPGLFVRVEVAAEESYTATLVPERAIGTDQSDKFVYVVDEKQTAQRRNVVLGTKQGRLRVIKSGIAPQDKVVISGGLLVRPGQQVETQEGQMEDSPARPVAVTQFKPAIDATSAASSPFSATVAPRVPANPPQHNAPVER